MKKSLLILFLNVVAIPCVWSQDPVFSQFYTSALYLNPALSGFEKDVVVSMNYRSQWAGVNLPFRTFQVSAVHPILQQGVRTKHLGGFGATLFSDEAGPNREVVSQGFSVASSYNFHLDRRGNHMIAAALQFGVLQRSINMDALQWSSQYSRAIGYDPSLPGESLITDRVTSPVINAGVVWRLVIDKRFEPAKIFYQGFSVANLNRPDGFYLDAREAPSILLKAHGGYLHSFSNGFEISPNYLVQHQHTTQLNIGAYGAYTLPEVKSKTITDLKVSLGCWYRLEDSVIITTGFSTAGWDIGFSYDANSFSLERSFQGASAYELSLAYRINVIKQVKKFATPLI